MVKTTVYIESWVDAGLRRIAEEEGKTKAAVMRETLTNYVNRYRQALGED